MVDLQAKVLVAFGYAPGNYSCKCVMCSTEFVGDKRACRCETCAKRLQASQHVEAPSSNQETGPLWTPTLEVERMMREVKETKTITTQISTKVLEGLLHDSLLWRQDRLKQNSAVETSNDPAPSAMRALTAAPIPPCVFRTGCQSPEVCKQAGQCESDFAKNLRKAASENGSALINTTGEEL